MTEVAPRFINQSVLSLFPVTAVTSYPNSDRSFTATEPTPPVAPVTITGPDLLVIPECSSF